MTKTLFIFTLLLTWTSKISACTCKGESTVKGSVDNSELVVSATVISQTVTADLSKYIIIQGDTTNYKYKLYKFSSRVVKLKVNKLFKGQLTSDTLTIITPPNSAGCGVYFEAGKKYIIYGSTTDEVTRSNNLVRQSADKNTYWTNKCTRTNHWCEGEETEILNCTKK